LKKFIELQELINEIPPEYLAVSTSIIEYAGKLLSKKLNENILLTLTDHINFAIERKNKQLEYKNPLFWEIKSFYPEEFKIGLYALELIQKELNVLLAEDEASFIALHIVNAELDSDMGSTVQITELIQALLEIVRAHYSIALNESSLHYGRFITHLKYFGQRLFKKSMAPHDDATLQDIIRNRYPNDYACADQIRMYVKEHYHQSISDEDMIFLTVHLRSITTN
jgi:beta-glucoside operon transcriptional antiterminator